MLIPGGSEGLQLLMSGIMWFRTFAHGIFDTSIFDTSIFDTGIIKIRIEIGKEEKT